MFALGGGVAIHTFFVIDVGPCGPGRASVSGMPQLFDTRAFDIVNAHCGSRIGGYIMASRGRKHDFTRPAGTIAFQRVFPVAIGPTFGSQFGRGGGR